MGAQISQVQTPQGNRPVEPVPTQANYSPAQQQMNGKGMAQGPSGKGPNQSYSGQKVMYSPLSEQPTMGQPNPYPNTIGQWDNASIKPQPRQGGKGKGI
jgi:hypothetical protein